MTAAGATARGTAGFTREPEVVAEASGLLQRLGEHLVLSDVVVRDGSTRELHRLLEVALRDLGHRIVVDCESEKNEKTRGFINLFPTVVSADSFFGRKMVNVLKEMVGTA